MLHLIEVVTERYLERQAKRVLYVAFKAEELLKTTIELRVELLDILHSTLTHLGSMTGSLPRV